MLPNTLLGEFAEIRHKKCPVVNHRGGQGLEEQTPSRGNSCAWWPSMRGSHVPHRPSGVPENGDPLAVELVLTRRWASRSRVSDPMDWADKDESPGDLPVGTPRGLLPSAEGSASTQS